MPAIASMADTKWLRCTLPIPRHPSLANTSYHDGKLSMGSILTPPASSCEARAASLKSTSGHIPNAGRIMLMMPIPDVSRLGPPRLD